MESKVKESKEGENSRVKVKNLVSAFCDKEKPVMSAGSKDKGKRAKPHHTLTSGSVSMRRHGDAGGMPANDELQSQSTGSLSLKSDQSIAAPLAFGDKRSMPQSTGSLSLKSDQSIAAPLAFGDKRSMPQSTGSLSLKSDQSIAAPLAFGDKRSMPQSTGSWSLKSDQSIAAPLAFRDKKLKQQMTGSVSLKSDQSMEPPLVFKGKQWEKPDGEYLNYETDSAKESNPNSSNQIKWNPYGLPKPWGGHVIGPPDPTRFKPPPVAVFPALKADHRVADDVIHSRMKNKPLTSSGYATDMSDNSKDNLHYLKTNLLESQRFERRRNLPSHPSCDHQETESVFSSETSDYSGSRDSQYDEDTVILDDREEEVICEICHQAPAVKICLTCNISYCESDVRSHYKVASMQRHRLTDAIASVDDKRCRHYQEDLDVYCRTDRMQICRICVQGNHRGHDVIRQKMQHMARQTSSANEQQGGPPDTVLPPPGEIRFLSVKPTSVGLSWGSPAGLEGPMSFRVKWSSLWGEDHVVISVHRFEIDNLELGQQYFFSVATQDQDGNLSKWVEASVFTAVPAPRHLTKEHSDATSLSLKWTKGDKLEQIPHRFLIEVTSPGKEPQAIHTEDCYKMFSGLEADTEYHISVSTVLNSRCSEPVSTKIHTDPCLMDMLAKMGLDEQYDIKLTLSKILELNQSDMSERNLETVKALPEAFLKKLMMMNANARSVKCASHSTDSDGRDAINPLDLITAVFLCSDGILQQQMIQKMSLCQFAVPLLLPNSENGEITLMLWAMRGIVRTFRPSQAAFRKLNCEERLVSSDIPLVSFVRLGKMAAVSKSQMLNKLLLSNNQQYHDTFYHRHMVSGDVPRRISDGLVEISWYLPCGDRNQDKFIDPVAFTNLRGDIRVFDKQFSFLCDASATVYVFCDESDVDYFKTLEGRVVRAKLILISSKRGKTFELKMMTLTPSFKTTNISRNKTYEELIRAVHDFISKTLEKSPDKVQLVDLADRARCCGILVDEDADECQSAKKNAHTITARITHTSEFKDKQLSSQGEIWKAISWVENEKWRLRKAGKQNTEEYRKSLKTKEKELRRKQQRFGMSNVMSGFLHGAMNCEVQRYYFLKWLEMDLERLSRKELSVLQEWYKEQCQRIPRDKELPAEMDKQMSACSLHLEHFFRECGQLYEGAGHLPEYSCQRKNMEQLPVLCAQMLLDGFPIELVDGDAVNIPMKWIGAVLTELHSLMDSSSKLKVITVIGAESSGKSTLLNTMFGLRFAAAGGRSCSRGAFAQLINVNVDLREDLDCDCVLIIDTEGLKPHQTPQDDYSHERDREVASLAVALSDVTIVCGEKDILEIVLHAFMRLKDEGKPLCYFVHMNMSDLPPAEKKMRDRDLVERLIEIIRTDANLAKAKVTKIWDVMKLDCCGWYVPNIWRGTPPMAPFNVEYSETVQTFKKQLMRDLKKCSKKSDLTDVIRKIERVWRAL